MKIVKNEARKDETGTFIRELAAYKYWNKSQVIALVATSPDEIEVRVISKAKDIFSIPADTPCFSSWPGQWSNDIFSFTAGDVQEAMAVRWLAATSGEYRS